MHILTYFIVGWSLQSPRINRRSHSPTWTWRDPLASCWHCWTLRGGSPPRVAAAQRRVPPHSSSRPTWHRQSHRTRGCVSRSQSLHLDRWPGVQTVGQIRPTSDCWQRRGCTKTATHGHSRRQDDRRKHGMSTKTVTYSSVHTTWCT